MFLARIKIEKMRRRKNKHTITMSIKTIDIKLYASMMCLIELMRHVFATNISSSRLYLGSTRKGNKNRF